MKLSVFIITIFAFFVTQVCGYLSERSAPFKVTLENTDSTTLQVRRGDTIHISWGLTPGVRFPLYGYASARTARTDVGLLAPDASRTQPYSYSIETDISVLDYQYKWTIADDVPTGKYQIGVGFFYHEVSPQIHIIE